MPSTLAKYKCRVKSRTRQTACMHLDHATVIGSGRTAPTIAAAFATAGLQVRLAARDAARAAAAAELASTWSGRRVEPCALGEGAVAGAGLVLESIAENHE